MRNILFILFSALLITSCYEETDWVEENSTTNGYHYPMIQDVLVVAEQDSFAAGDVVPLEVYFWSRDEVKELDLSQTIDDVETLLSTSAPNTTYDVERNVDKMEMSYTVPADTEGKDITLSVVVRTIHDLTRTKSTTVKVGQ